MAITGRKYVLANDESREFEIQHLSNGEIQFFIGTAFYGRGEGMDFIINENEARHIINILTDLVTSLDPPTEVPPSETE